MKYNLKITNYVDDVQINYYSNPIFRKEDNNNDDNKDSKQSNKSSLQTSRDNISDTWYNPKTCKNEIIPYGFQVIDKPFSNEKMLFPIDRFLDENIFISMEFEEMLPFVEKKIKEEEERNHFMNVMRSLRRTKQNLYSIARANEWQLFVTFTFCDEKLRNDYDLVKKYFAQKIQNVKKRNKLDFNYLLIPEQDKNGNWHFHGLFKDIQGLKLKRAVNPHNGNYVTHNGVQVYNISQFDSVGFNTATFVQNNAKVTRYILKYITKDMEIKFPGKRKYLSSKGLSKGEVILFDIEDESQINEKISEVYAYDMVQTHENVVINPYSNTEVKYKQFKK